MDAIQAPCPFYQGRSGRPAPPRGSEEHLERREPEPRRLAWPLPPGADHNGETMCGRLVQDYSWSDAVRFFELMEQAGIAPREPADFQPSWNICPTQPAAVVRADGPAVLRWGLVPSWAKEESGRKLPKPFNARAEGLAKSGMFRSSLQSRRCVVMASGFYEWTSGPSGKTPYYIYDGTRTPLLMAGLWAQRGDLETFTIVTCRPNPFMAQVHHRMPVLLSPEGALHWLDAPDQALLIPWSGELAKHEVWPAVGNVRNNMPELTEPASKR